MARKMVIDTSSLFSFFKYHYFDKNNGNQVNKKLNDFIIGKIKGDEIIVIDKVYAELGGSYGGFQKEIKSEVYDTNEASLLDDVRALSRKHYIKDNEKFFTDQNHQIDQNRIGVEMQRNENQCADLFLVAHCLLLKSLGDEPVLITDETTNPKGYQKLIRKLPSICIEESIPRGDISYLLFEIYKDELKFDLQIIAK